MSQLDLLAGVPAPTAPAPVVPAAPVVTVSDVVQVVKFDEPVTWGLLPSPFRWPVERRDFTAEDYDPMEDMTLQPAFCQQCGGILARNGAYLICQSRGHEEGIECHGRLDDPFHEDWERYIEMNGREAFEEACSRSFRRRHPEFAYRS